MRYVQFVSLYKLAIESQKAVNDSRIVEISPPNIMSKSRVYNVVMARHFEDLYGVKMEEQYTIKANEKELIDLFWDEFKEYRKDRKPGEEYELTQHWGDDLELNPYFELVDENIFREKSKQVKKSPEDLLREIEEDPMQQSELDEYETDQLRKFQEEHTNKDLNMAIVMYMIGAMEYFKGMPKEKVRDIAFEIAMLGRSGISPEKKGYKLNKIPGKTFSGYKLLAYYYISWAIALPQMLEELQMPFDSEYKLALSMHKPSK